MAGQLTEEGGQLGDQGGDEQRVPELTDHGHQGVGGPGAEPQHHVGDSHLCNSPYYTAVLGATGIHTSWLWVSLNTCTLQLPTCIEKDLSGDGFFWMHVAVAFHCTPVLCFYNDFGLLISVSYPGKGECADPVNEDAILEEEGGASPRARTGSVS